jgi:hypothetical protein
MEDTWANITSRSTCKRNKMAYKIIYINFFVKIIFYFLKLFSCVNLKNNF